MKRRLWSGRLRLPLMAGMTALAVVTISWAATLCYQDTTGNYIISATQNGFGTAATFNLNTASSTNSAILVNDGASGAQALTIISNGNPGAGGAWLNLTNSADITPAIYAQTANLGTSGLAGKFSGAVAVYGNFTACNGTKCWKMDDPRDPANKYLLHASEESPERLNCYSGNLTTDSGGLGVVRLPSYYDLINGDSRYQLTVIGSAARAWVQTEEANNQFTIKTDTPSVKVSWRIEGVRQDPWASAHPFQAEVAKPPSEVGTYIDPVDYGQPMTKGLEFAQEPRMPAGASIAPASAARRAPSGTVMSVPSRSPVGRRVVAPR